MQFIQYLFCHFSLKLISVYPHLYNLRVNKYEAHGQDPIIII